MNRIAVVFTIDTSNLPENFQQIIQHEREVISEWEKEGILDHFFLRQTRNGAVFIFKDVEETRVMQLMESLPLYQFKKSVEILPLIKQF